MTVNSRTYYYYVEHNDSNFAGPFGAAKSCGARMYGSCSHGVRYYVCGKKCGRPSVQAEEVETRVLLASIELLRKPAVARAVIQRARAADPKRIVAAERLAAIDARLGRIPSERERLIDAFQSGLVGKDDLRARLGRVDRDRARLEKERAALRTEGQAVVEQEARRRAWLTAAEEVAAWRAEKALRDKVLQVDADGRSPLAGLRERIVRGVLDRVTVRQGGKLEYAAALPMMRNIKDQSS